MESFLSPPRSVSSLFSSLSKSFLLLFSISETRSGRDLLCQHVWVRAAAGTCVVWLVHMRKHTCWCANPAFALPPWSEFWRWDAQTGPLRCSAAFLAQTGESQPVAPAAEAAMALSCTANAREPNNSWLSESMSSGKASNPSLKTPGNDELTAFWSGSIWFSSADQSQEALLFSAKL